MYYAILSAAVTMFGFQFLFNQQYQKIRGSSPKAALKFLLGANIAGVIILLAINKFNFSFTPFTFIVAVIAASDMFGYSICSIKALGKVNLSVFSVFAMLGGMVLPFLAGVLFFDESMTPGKVICLILILIALLLTVGGGDKKTGLIYCFGVFIFNGLYGVIAKFYSWADFAKTSEAAYSVLISAVIIILSGTAMLFIKKPEMTLNIRAAGMSAGYGIISCTANLLLLISLRELPASIQYPFVTGGVIIVSTIICCFTPDKPTKKELISVVVSFAGLLALVLI